MCLFVLNFFKLNQGFFGGYILYENQRTLLLASAIFRRG